MATLNGLLVVLPAGAHAMAELRPLPLVRALTLKPGKLVLSQLKVKRFPFRVRIMIGEPLPVPVTTMDPLVARLSTQLKPGERFGRVSGANAPV